MAFVNSSPKNITFHTKASQDHLGPGSYDVDATDHKKLMSILRPKKTAPFNQTSKRGFNKSNSPTPGKSLRRLSCFLRREFSIRAGPL